MPDLGDKAAAGPETGHNVRAGEVGRGLQVILRVRRGTAGKQLGELAGEPQLLAEGS